MSRSNFASNAGALAILFGLAAGTLTLAGLGAAKMGLNPVMTDYDGAQRVVEKAGFTDVKADGYGWFSCGYGEDSDMWRTHFTATNAQGQQVEGVVCDGILKNATIRFD